MQLREFTDCGQPAQTALIADGTKTKPGQFPWHVAIYYIPSSHTLICSGTLIAANMVVSGESAVDLGTFLFSFNSGALSGFPLVVAAHCFYDEGKGKAKKNATEYLIVVGKVTRNFFITDSKVVQKTIEVK